MEVIREVAHLRSELAKAREEAQDHRACAHNGSTACRTPIANRESEADNDIVVVSVFVNPTQFNNPEDLRTYPRTEEADCKKLQESGVDYALVPSVEEMYPVLDTRVFDLGPVAEVMEGAMRPGHFNGVAQIVSKLFSIVEPRPRLLRRKRLPADSGDTQDGGASSALSSR